MFSVEMLPAAHGDCLWIEWRGDQDRIHRMLIDGGPAHTYRALLERVQALAPAERVIEALVVTHIDADHIEGVIRLLRDRAALGLEIKRVFFNGIAQLATVPGEPDDDLGAKAGECLGLLLEQMAGEATEINPGFDGGWIGVDLEHGDGRLPVVVLPGGLRLTVVSPDVERLWALSDAWDAELAKTGLPSGDRSRLLEVLESDARLRPLLDVLGVEPSTFGDGFDEALDDLDDFDEALDDELGGGATPGSDGSPANGSSIAFLAEYEHEACAEPVRYLFAGDAHAPVLAASLRAWCREHDVERVALDGFKIPHHGSIGNVTEALLELISSRSYLISTSGARFRHPHAAAIEMLVEHHHPAELPDLIFNYSSPTTEPWADPDLQRGRFVARYPAEPAPSRQ